MSADHDPMAAVQAAAELRTHRDVLVKGFYPDLDALIRRVARQRYGAARTGSPDPLRLIAAANDTAAAARVAVSEAVEAARGDGHSWAEIAEALDISAFPGTTLADSAWRDTARGTWIRWRCSTCGGRVTEQEAPRDSAAITVEEGHTADCARHRADQAIGAGR